MVNGFYSDVDLPEPHQDQSEIQEKYDEMEGNRSVYEDDERYTILEMHVDLEMPEPFNDKDGLARPYVVTIDKSSKTILSIRKNWYENAMKRKLSDSILFIIDIFLALGFMVQDLFILLVGWLNRLRPYCVSLLMQVLYRIYLLVLKLVVLGLKGMSRLLCLVSSEMSMCLVVRYEIPLRLYLIKNHPQYCTSCWEILSKRADELGR